MEQRFNKFGCCIDHFEGYTPDALDELENQRADAFISCVRLDD